MFACQTSYLSSRVASGGLDRFNGSLDEPKALTVWAQLSPGRRTWRFIEFFLANIRNRNTRAAYAQAIGQFFSWCESRGVRDLPQVRPVVIAGYIEQLQLTHSPPTVKQHLAAVRMLFDWFVVG